MLEIDQTSRRILEEKQLRDYFAQAEQKLDYEQLLNPFKKEGKKRVLNNKLLLII